MQPARAALILVASASLACTPAASASAITVESLARISGASPFPGSCGLDSPIAMLDAEAEPTIAVKPGHPSSVAVAWIQDQGRSNVVASSRNGGRAWSRAFVPGLSQCTGGAQPVAVDPWLSFGPRGRLFLGSATAAFPPGGDPVAGIVVSRSSNSGRSWGRSRYVQRPTGIPPGLFWDKPAIAADPHRGGRLYASFDQNSQDATAIGSSFSSRSVDGGRTWSAPAEIGTTPNVQPTLPDGTEVSALPLDGAAVAPDGSLYVVWSKLSVDGVSVIRLARSRDGGRSFSRPRAVDRVRAQAFLPTVAVAGDGTVGALYYAMASVGSPDPAGATEVRLAASTRGRRGSRSARIAGPFDITTAAQGGGEYFVGDYEGLAGLPHGFAAAFAQARPQARVGPSDIFFARVGTGTGSRRR